MKQCPECARNGEGPKPLSDFNKCSRWADGLQYIRRDHQRAKLRAHYAKSGGKYNEQKKVWRKANPKAARRVDVRKQMRLKYGLTQERYERMFAAQGGRCAICERALQSVFDDARPFANGKPSDDLVRVDHCHSTGEVRGLLCLNCNAGLGSFMDTEQFLLAAARYLTATRTAAQPTSQVVSQPQTETLQGEKGPASRDPDRAQAGARRRVDELSPF